ncbi:MAG: class I SAM-dependent methyltransferase [Rhizobacter sp.]|nr:class I SAM-dependent methyltransferase [Bacteriovorax sp.]
MSDEKALLKKRCEESKGTSSEHIYAVIDGQLKNKIKNSSNILDLGAGIGNFKKYLQKNNLYKIEEADFSFTGSREIFYQVDLNEKFNLQKKFDVVTIVEVLHFMENPRHLMRQAIFHLKDSGIIVVSIPNLHSMTSIFSFIFRGVHSAFAGKNYPSHITPIHKIDMLRIFSEVGMNNVQVFPSQIGRVPGLKSYWQRIFPGSRNVFFGEFFSDNIIFIAKN